MKPIIRSLIAALGIGVFAASTLWPTLGSTQDTRDAKAMAALKVQTAKLGEPKIEGTYAVGGKETPALYFGSTEMNNNNAVVDEVAKGGGEGMAATLFVKGGDDYTRVATTVPNPDGSGPAVGTALEGPALDSVKAGKAYFGEVPVLRTTYVGYYEPIIDPSGAVIGAYFVGYKK